MEFASQEAVFCLQEATAGTVALKERLRKPWPAASSCRLICWRYMAPSCTFVVSMVKCIYPIGYRMPVKSFGLKGYASTELRPPPGHQAPSLGKEFNI